MGGVVVCDTDYGNKRSARGVVLDFDRAEKKTVIPIDARNLPGIEKRIFHKTKFFRVDASPLRERRRMRARRKLTGQHRKHYGSRKRRDQRGKAEKAAATRRKNRPYSAQ